MNRVLVVRLDAMGDMLVCGPAIRAVAAGARRVTVLAGPGGAAAARLLPGVDEVLVWRCPWIDPRPEAVSAADVADVVARVACVAADEAIVLTSFHQSALPTALLLRMAGITRITAVSTDYPGSLLDVRLADPADGPEPERMLQVVRGAGFSSPPGDDGTLAVSRVPDDPPGLPPGRFVAVHPGADAPARTYPESSWAAVVARLSEAGRDVVVTGGDDERGLTARVAAAGQRAVDAGGRLDLPSLAAVLSRSAVLVAGNTGPAHLAAAVGTPVVSLFAPVVSRRRWAPYGVPSVVLGDQGAACRDSRARICPVPGHPCLTSVPPTTVVAAVDSLAAAPVRAVVAG